MLVHVPPHLEKYGGTTKFFVRSLRSPILFCTPTLKSAAPPLLIGAYMHARCSYRQRHVYLYCMRCFPRLYCTSSATRFKFPKTVIAHGEVTRRNVVFFPFSSPILSSYPFPSLLPLFYAPDQLGCLGEHCELIRQCLGQRFSRQLFFLHFVC